MKILSGDRVKNKKYGEGVILKVEENSDLVTVLFEKGEKTFSLSGVMETGSLKPLSHSDDNTDNQKNENLSQSENESMSMGEFVEYIKQELGSGWSVQEDEIKDYLYMKGYLRIFLGNVSKYDTKYICTDKGKAIGILFKAKKGSDGILRHHFRFTPNAQAEIIPGLVEFLRKAEKTHYDPAMDFDRMRINGERKIEDIELYKYMLQFIRSIYGKTADFRENQYEAIEAVIHKPRTLVVQKTGWGKSLVYFASTKYFRERGEGVTIIISPLLSLMDNQKEAAEALGLSCVLLNSSNNYKTGSLRRMLKNEVDVAFITPETLYGREVQSVIDQIDIGLLVIDEVHCISDWGHDFRLFYGSLYRFIEKLPLNVHILGTTATANERVIEDVKRQMGEDLYISKGSLSRESLYIQVIEIQSRVERYAWLLDNINSLPGTGIIYCLTRKDCDVLAEFLNQNGISAESYHSGNSHATNSYIEKEFMENRIKVIVATIKLGMGYDKEDVSFVIHYQTPGNIVAYYQQIGRAGRNGEKAYIVLMHGKEDDLIREYFMENAFPSEKECQDILTFLGNNVGKRRWQIYGGINEKKRKIDKALDFLINDGCVKREWDAYWRTAVPFVYNGEHYEEIKSIRNKEYQEMIRLIGYDKCYSRYITECLEDPNSHDCGHCTNCLGEDFFEEYPSEKSIKIAKSFFEREHYPIHPRTEWRFSNGTKKEIPGANETGMCLSVYGSEGIGALVMDNKYNKDSYCEAIIKRCVKEISSIAKKYDIKHMTAVPSLTNIKVQILALEICDRCGLEYIEPLDKKEAPPQKNMENTQHQCQNAYDSFYYKSGECVPEKIILMDDIVDSGWTLTVCGYLLRENGCKTVYPFALADSSTSGDD